MNVNTWHFVKKGIVLFLVGTTNQVFECMQCSTLHPIFDSSKSELCFLEPKRKMISNVSYDIIDSSYLHLRGQCLKSVFYLLSDHPLN